MYKMIVFNQNNTDFGNQVAVYKGNENNFIIIKDRGETAYYFADSAMVKLYPANTYIRNIGYNYNFDKRPDNIEEFDIDLNKYGYTDFPYYLKNLFNT